MEDGRITVDDRDGVAVVALVGEHDLSTASEVGYALGQPRPAGLVVDLSRTTFLDSSILGVLLTAARESEQRQASFAVVIPENPMSAAHRIFDLTGLISALPVGTDLDTAVEASRNSTAPTG
jgi:anti-sigma B factor antagonist